MTRPKHNVVVGRYSRPGKRARHFNFRVSKKIFYFLIPVIILGGIFYFLFISGRFEVKEVNISGLKAVNEEEVRKLINDVLAPKKFGVLKSKNHFLLSRDKLQSSILSSIHKIGSVRIEKTTDALNIAIEEREAIGIWCKGSDCFYFDKKGIIFEESPKSSGSLFISIEDMRNMETNLGSAVLSEPEVVLAEDSQRLLRGNFPFSAVTIVITADGEYELLTTEGWRVLLNKNDGLEYQLSNLKYVIDEKIKTRRGELEYVDLRLGNRVYYKYTAETID